MRFKTKYVWNLTLLLLMMVAVGACAQQEEALDTWAAIQAEGRMLIGLDDSFPPFGFRSDNNELIGFDIDLGNALGERLGIEIDWQPAEWSGIIMSLKTKKFDAIWSGMSITELRLEEVNFTKPYIGSAQVIILPYSNTEISGAADLAGKVVATQLGSTGEVACGKLEGLKELKLFEVYTEAINDLNTGRLDAVVIDDITARYYLQQQPGAFRILDDVLSYEPMGIAMRKEDETLLAAFDEALAGLIADGTYKTISEKWFREDMSSYLDN